MRHDPHCPPVTEKSVILEEEMELTKSQIVDLLTLLSAVESWSLSAGQKMPVYLIERIDASLELLRKGVE